MKVWSLLKHENLTSNKILWKRGEIAPSPLFHNIFNISLTSGIKITYSFVKCGCSIYFFLNSENLICRGTDISKYFRESLDFEITRVDCASTRLYFLPLRLTSSWLWSAALAPTGGTLSPLVFELRLSFKLNFHSSVLDFSDHKNKKEKVTANKRKENYTAKNWMQETKFWRTKTIQNIMKTDLSIGRLITSRKHAYIILTLLNPTFI